MNKGALASRLVSGFAILLSTLPATAELRLPNVMSSHAVLQRDAPLHVWGWSSPSASVTVSFHNQHASTRSNSFGEWSLYLAPEPKGGPYTLSVDGGSEDGKKDLTDILVGDVWIASGQSNMALQLSGNLPQSPVKDSAREVAQAANPRIRFLQVPSRSSNIPMEDQDSVWKECTPATAAKFSAVAYFFGRILAASHDVPIGLIQASWGGTPADSWVSLETLGSNLALHDSFANRADFANQQIRAQSQIVREKAEDAVALAAGKPLPSHPWHANQESWIPAALFNGMVAPLSPLSVKGFIWYQGESDSDAYRSIHYASLFPALIQDWRMHFRQGDLPFLYVQISSYKGSSPGWAIVRDAQRRTLFLRNTAMAVSTDVGEAKNIHPADKQTVGSRLALAADAIAYGGHAPYSGPLFRQATPEASGIRVWFDFADGLTTNGKPIEGFEIAGEDRKFKTATAVIDHDTVVLTAPDVAAPLYVRYDWNSVTPPGLYNDSALPASTFTSEDPARFSKP
jgi:sialate O-acetylesterase